MAPGWAQESRLPSLVRLWSSAPCRRRFKGSPRSRQVDLPQPDGSRRSESSTSASRCSAAPSSKFCAMCSSGWHGLDAWSSCTTLYRDN